MNLLLLDPDAVAPSGRAVLTPEQSRHVRSVLRSEPGAELRVGVLNGPKGMGRVRTIGPDCIELDCVFDAEPPPRPRIDLLLALPRPKVMKRLWAQLAALGVGRVIITNAARVERNYFDTHVLDPAFYTPLLREGLQQAQDTWLPAVRVHRRFKPLVERELDTLSDAALRLVAHPSAMQRLEPLARDAGQTRVLLAIGPEGGWIPYELDLLTERGFHPVTLGSRILRSDTACVAALALAHAAFDFPAGLVE